MSYNRKRYNSKKNISLGNFFPEQFKPQHRRVVGLKKDGMLIPSQVLLNKSVQKFKGDMLLRRKLINQRRRAKHEHIQKLITDFQAETWDLFSRNGDHFTRNDLNEHERKVYDKIYLFLRKNNVKNISQMKLINGNKRTLILKNTDYVLKIFPKGVYEVERDAYEVILKNGLHDYFVEHWCFDDDSRTVFAKKLDSDKPIDSNYCNEIRSQFAKYKGAIPYEYQSQSEQKVDPKIEILDVLSDKGLTMTDLKYGDNIGQINGVNVVYDLKSLKVLR